MTNLDVPFDTSPAVIVGDTADAYLQRARTILRNENVNPTVTMELSPERGGVLCGIDETLALQIGRASWRGRV